MPSTTTPTDAGDTFRAAREGAGLSVRSLAARAEVSPSTISRWERGEREIAEATYQHLAQALADYVAGRWAA